MPGRIARDQPVDARGVRARAAEFRAKVIAHKKNRTVRLGAHITLIFEDELTIRYQIQEMLRIEKTFEERGIQDELDAYVPLIPDGTNLKATMMIEYEDPSDSQDRACAAEGRRESRLCRSRRFVQGVRHRGRGYAARERRKDVVGSFSSLRVRARDDSCFQQGRRGGARRRSPELHGAARRSRARSPGFAGAGLSAQQILSAGKRRISDTV